MDAVSSALGYVGGVLTCSAMVPQVYRVYRTRSAGDISWTMLIMTIVGQFFWIAHGIANKDPVVILFTIVSASMNASILFMKARLTDRGGASQERNDYAPVSL